FSKSTKRTSVLERCGASRLPSTSPIHWNFTSRAVVTVLSKHLQLLQTFETIMDLPEFDDDAITASSGFINTLKSFYFMLLLSYNQVFRQTDPVFDILQQKASNVVFCRRTVDNFYTDITNMKMENTFQMLFNEASDFTEYPTESYRVRRKRGGAQADPILKYRSLHYSIVDNILEQPSVFFIDLEELKFLQLLEP
ncbi:hypothetical protein EOD39_13068, partial [Acipenser ruthenus]